MQYLPPRMGEVPMGKYMRKVSGEREMIDVSITEVYTVVKII